MEGLNVIYERWVLYLLSLPKYMEEKVLFFLFLPHYVSLEELQDSTWTQKLFSL